jgi:hypothetical protein
MDHDKDRAPEAVARQILAEDPQLAELLAAQCRRLRDDSAEHRARERELVALSGPHQPRYRSQFWLPSAGVFRDRLTRVDDDDRSYVWLHDDDIVSLTDAHPYGNDPWAHNTDAARCLVELWATWHAQLVSSIRMCLFGGTEAIAATVRELDAADRVTHLELRTQDEEARHAAVGAAFPALRGLACGADEAATLLAEGAAELRALVVKGPRVAPSVLDLAARAPKLRHLGLFHAPTTEPELEALARHAVLDRLTSIELFSLNDATRFPFDALLARRGAFEHLRRVHVTGHLVPLDVKRRFEDWPEVEFISHDRRETIAFDFESLGGAAGVR